MLSTSVYHAWNNTVHVNCILYTLSVYYTHCIVYGCIHSIEYSSLDVDFIKNTDLTSSEHSAMFEMLSLLINSLFIRLRKMILLFPLQTSNLKDALTFLKFKKKIVPNFITKFFRF